MTLSLTGVIGAEPEARLPGEPHALPGLCGPSVRLSVAQAPQPWACFESTVPAEPCTVGSHGPLWPITAPLTLTAWLWLPQDSQVSAVPKGFSEATGQF